MSSSDAHPPSPVAEHSRQGFAAFYDDTSRTAYSFALHLTGDAAAAERVCEAAYLDCVNVLQQLDGSARQEHLLEAVRSHALKGGWLRPVSPASSAPDSAGAAVRAGLDSLPPPARRALELAFFGGLRAGEIAQLLDVPPAQVRALMREGLLALGKAARPDGGRP